MNLAQDELDELNPTVNEHKFGMPSLAELDYAMYLLRKRYPVTTFLLRRKIKWLLRKIRRHYGVTWVTPWDKRR